MKIHRTTIQSREYHESIEITEDLKKELPTYDFSNTENWSKADWENFWEDAWEISEEGSEQLVDTDVWTEYDDKTTANWIEGDNN